MILDNFKNASNYYSLHPLFERAFKFLSENNLTTIEPGRYEIGGKSIYAIVDRKIGKAKENALIEAHNQYIDIQLCIIGAEKMGWKARCECKNEKDPYNIEKDIIFFNDKPDIYFDVLPMNFVIFFPEDGHAPMIGDELIKKVVMKVIKI